MAGNVGRCHGGNISVRGKRTDWYSRMQGRAVKWTGRDHTGLDVSQILHANHTALVDKWTHQV